MAEEIITQSFEETKKIGENFAKKIKNGAIIALYGQLGSGKTTFTQGLAKGLGIKRRITSPTFIMLRSYKLKMQPFDFAQGKSAKYFYHIDLYRIESAEDIKGLGIEEIMDDSQNIIVIEWAERLGLLLPKKRIDLRFEYIVGDKRKISISELSS